MKSTHLFVKATYIDDSTHFDVTILNASSLTVCVNFVNRYQPIHAERCTKNLSNLCGIVDIEMMPQIWLFHISIIIHSTCGVGYKLNAHVNVDEQVNLALKRANI